jgi:hypothetical protein
MNTSFFPRVQHLFPEDARFSIILHQMMVTSKGKSWVSELSRQAMLPLSDELQTVA